MLKLAGETNLKLEKIELINYVPGLKDSADLETGTHTIVPTSKPAIGSAQYSKSLTMAASTDSRLAVMRIAARLNVNITNLGTATHLYCSVRVDVDDADHELFNEDWTSTGNKLDAVDTHSANKATLFNLLKDGAAHIFYFLFWADTASQAQIDVVELWFGVGSCSTASVTVLQLTHTGFIQTQVYCERVGTGNMTARVATPGESYVAFSSFTASAGSLLVPSALVDAGLVVVALGTVATDLNSMYRARFVLRSEQ